MVIEKLVGAEIPRRASLIRILYSEMGRILNHLLNVTTQAMDVGALGGGVHRTRRGPFGFHLGGRGRGDLGQGLDDDRHDDHAEA